MVPRDDFDFMWMENFPHEISYVMMQEDNLFLINNVISYRFLCVLKTIINPQLINIILFFNMWVEWRIRTTDLLVISTYVSRTVLVLAHHFLFCYKTCNIIRL